MIKYGNANIERKKKGKIEILPSKQSTKEAKEKVENLIFDEDERLK